jgi:predicted GH43/DUF377 family glycosyl hydrolase
MATSLQHYRVEKYVGKKDYLDLLRIYARSHRLKLPDGTVVPWIDEDLNPDTGEWIARDVLLKRGVKDRGKDYNHSTFCDLVISGLVGLRPAPGDYITVEPLVPDGVWDYFCLDNVAYRGRTITVLYDRTGQRYGKGPGLRVFADGKEMDASRELRSLASGLPPILGSGIEGETAGGWSKCPQDPVLGGKLGTCFDVSVLKEGEKFRMWFSWRPKGSVALVESTDGIHWSEPAIVLAPNKTSGWELDINRPVVIRRPDGYHMWYTGQARGHSWIGYATSPDGKTWKRMSPKPVLSPEKPWEKTSVMCPHVIYDAETKLYRMWYSGGEQYEPNAIGYATSPDGRAPSATIVPMVPGSWTKHPQNPIFRPDPKNAWEQERVTACQVVRQGDWHVMFYIGFRDVDHAQIGVARSKDGITGWERHKANPIIRPGLNEWDHDAVYKPYAILDGDRWLLWYNGRRGGVEQIGLATHEGADLGW